MAANLFELDERSAIFSDCRIYRYQLLRRWDADLPLMAVIGLNPSTADETKDDPTIRRCISFARAWGHGGLIMLNLFAWRATVPADMYSAMSHHHDIVGPLNDYHILDQTNIGRCKTVVAAWGQNKTYGRANDVVRMLNQNSVRVGAFRLTKNRSPEHPLYLPGSIAEPVYGWGAAQ